MKLFNSKFLLLFVFATAMSCTHSGDLKSELTGKWRITEMKFQMLDQMDQMGKMQVQMYQDSISKTTDTAVLNKLNTQLQDVQKSIADFHSKQDSSMKQSLWEFKQDGSFGESSGGETKNGTWSVNDKKMMLYTKVDNENDSMQIKLDQDLLTLQLDSMNYIRFTKLKE